MIKISVKLALCYLLCCAPILAVAESSVNVKAVKVAMQTAKISTQKNAGNAFADSANKVVSKKSIQNNHVADVASFKSNIGLLVTALILFVMRSSRGKV